jgi:hypothetical protein
MTREPVRNERGRAPETEAWKVIFSAFAVSGSLVIGWTLFVLLTDSPPRPTRLGGHVGEITQTQPAPAPAKP